MPNSVPVFGLMIARVFQRFYPSVEKRDRFRLIDYYVFIAGVKLSEQSDLIFAYLAHVYDNSVFRRQPRAFAGGLEFLLNLDFVYEIDVGVFSRFHVHLLEGIVFFGDPHGAGKGEFLGAFGTEMEAVAIVVSEH